MKLSKREILERKIESSSTFEGRQIMGEALSSTAAAQTLMELGGIPIDRVAYRVVGPGEHYERPLELRMLCFDNAPPICDRARNLNSKNEVPTRDLSGIRFGRLTVIGYWGRGKKSDGLENQHWVCRCLCGLFTIRKAKTVVRAKPQDTLHMCDACLVEHLIKLGAPKDKAFMFAKDRTSMPLGEKFKLMDLLGIGKVGYHKTKADPNNPTGRY